MTTANQIKIAFFDIDGTILCFGEKDLRPGVRDALLRLQKRGVRLFLATGRMPYTVPKFSGITFDGMLCFNGSYCFDRDGVIFADRLDKKDVRTLIKNAKSVGLPVLVAAAKRFGSNFFQEELDEYMRISGHDCNVLEDYEDILRDDVYQLMVAAGADHDELLLKNTSNLKIARWTELACDVIPVDCGKAFAIGRVLAHYGLRPEEAMAFGDGGNDLEMIEYAGIGVAMGNAVDAVRHAADYITDECGEEGVRTALKHFGLL